MGGELPGARSLSSAELAERGFELHEADVLDPEALRGAGRGVEAAYYLIHSMGRGAGGDFEERERQGAGTSRRWRSARESGGSSTSGASVTARSRSTYEAAAVPPGSFPISGRR